MSALTILSTGQRWVAVNKPGGIAVEKHFDHDTVEKRALAQFKRPGATKQPYIGIVHRLDRPVSGVLLLAQNKSTLVALNKAFAERHVEKTYWALVEHAPQSDHGQLRHFLTRDKTRRKAIASLRPIPQAKEAILTYRVLGNASPQGCLLEIKPLTGKYHQIRVQLATAGMPIIGDSMYGSQQLFGLNQIALHARSLVFNEPNSGKVVKVEAPISTPWKVADIDY